MGAALWCSCDDRPAAVAAPKSPPLPATLVEDAAEFSGDNAYVHCAALCELGPRSTGSPAYMKQVAYLAEHLNRAGWQAKAQPFSPLPELQMLNVHASYGEKEGARPLIVTCHIDTKGQGEEAILGADDGASGAAVILELARMLARHPQLAEQVELVFFDGEESFGKHITSQDGLFGSRFDVVRRGNDLPRYMINLDMVGGAGKTIGVPFADTSLPMYEQYERAIRTLGLSEERWTLYPGSYLDDHCPFLEAGVDALNLIAMFQGSNWWHTKRDDMSRISPRSLEETGRVVLQLIRQLLAAE